MSAVGRDRDIAARPVAPKCAPTAFYLPKRARRPGQLPATMTTSDSAISAHAQPAWSGWLQAIITPCENQNRSDEHTSELQSLMRISYAVFCLYQTHTYHDIDTA